MPTYEYECGKCGCHFERFQSISAEPLKKCPQCRGKLRRVISGGAGIIFKGSGFYATDYRSSSYKEGERRAREVAEPKKKEKGKKKTAAKKSETGKAKETKKTPAKGKQAAKKK